MSLTFRMLNSWSNLNRRWSVPVRLTNRLWKNYCGRVEIQWSARLGQQENTAQRMLKKAVQQGRSERRGEEVQTALRVGRSPLQWILANGKAPTAFPTSEKLLLSVEPLSDARMPHGKRRVSARRGWAGEKSDFFSILLEKGFLHPHNPARSASAWRCGSEVHNSHPVSRADASRCASIHPSPWPYSRRELIRCRT